MVGPLQGLHGCYGAQCAQNLRHCQPRIQFWPDTDCWEVQRDPTWKGFGSGTWAEEMWPHCSITISKCCQMSSKRTTPHWELRHSRAGVPQWPCQHLGNQAPCIMLVSLFWTEAATCLHHSIGSSTSTQPHITWSLANRSTSPLVPSFNSLDTLCLHWNRSLPSPWLSAFPIHFIHESFTW